MNTKKIIIAARVMSAIFTPFYLPIVGLVALFVFSYLGLLPWAYKLLVLGMVYLFTILVPTLLIHLYHRYQGWTPLQIGVKERRMVPYAVSIFCYFACYYLMTRLRIPSFMARILMAALLIQIVCAIVNVCVEDFHPYRRHRWRHGSAHGVLDALCLQPRVVALLHPARLGHGGLQPHHPPPAHPRTGACRLWHRTVNRLYCYHLNCIS